jgi:asparagine N-glycosylation enzyme membrane subunit Stt3
VYIGIGTMLYLIYFPVVMGLSVWLLGWYGILAGIAVPLSGYLVLFYKEIITERFNTLKYSVRKKLSPALINDLGNIRKEILSVLGSDTLPVS